MTHPDILHMERHGYALNMEFSMECILCGDMSQLDENRHCENCRPVTCKNCGEDCPADDTHSGICADCIKVQAKDSHVAMSYIMHCFEELPRRMSEYCLDDESHFADWLANREAGNIHGEAKRRIWDKTEYNADAENFFRGIFSDIEESLDKLTTRKRASI